MRKKTFTSVRLNFFPAKHFQRFIFGRGSKSKIAGIFCKLFAIDQGVDLIFQKIVIVVLASGQNDVHFCGKVAILTGMSFVDQDCKAPVGVELGDILQNELELMYNGDDDLCTFFQQCSKFR